MKKNKLWAKIKIQEELVSWRGVEGGIDEDGVNYILNIIDQLEEPEVLSQEESINIVLDDLKEYIKEQQSLSQNVGLAHTSAGNDTHYRQYDYVLECVNEYEPSDDLQNLLVPKQEELESKIKVLIEAYKQEEDAYSNPENGWISGFIEDLKNLVEEEQKYYVDLDTAAYVAKWNGDDQVGIYTDDIAGSDEFEFHLTEEEIKNYDERFWPFAEPVGEDNDD